MNNEMNEAEKLLKEMGDVIKPFTIIGMTEYLGTDPSIYNIWKSRKVLPYRNVKKIVEYLEMHNDDVITLCGHLMAYYKSEEKKRNEKLETSKERNRQRSRDRYKAQKQN